MDSPWGEIEVADAHVHFFSHAFFTALARQKSDLSTGFTETPESVAGVLGWETPPSEPEALAAVWVKELDHWGVRGAALIASIPGDEASVAAAVKSQPGRFHGYFMVDPTAPDAAQRVRNGLVEGHLRGVCLFPAMHRFSIQDERVRAVLESAASHPGTLAFVHCGVLTVGVRAKLGLPSKFDMRFSNPIDLHAVALAFPKLRFVVPHFGAGYLREALMLCDLCPNVYLDTSSSNSWMRYQPAALDLKLVFRRCLDVIGPQRLLFGTDSSYFPRGWHSAIFESQSRALFELGVSAADARRIFGGNLAGLFGR